MLSSLQLLRVPRLAAPCLALGLVACAGGESTGDAFAASRTYVPVDDGLRWDASPAERFYLRPVGPATSGPGSGAHGGSGDVHWTTPQGWSEAPTSALRQANFRIGDDGTECYLTVLTGDGGGMAANLNRWRKQMSLPEASDEELAALPRAPFFGGEGVLVDLEGTFVGMGGSAAAEGYRLLGLAQVHAGQARFLKLVGPAATVAAEAEAFRALAASFHGDHARADDPHAGLDLSSGAVSVPEPATSGGGLRWEAPEGWEVAPQRPMRAVTFRLGASGTSECYVVVLGGAGGGLAANVNRWRAQMGAEALSEDELAALERVPMLGGEGTVVEIPGTYTGMGDADIADALMLGAVCLLPDSSVFVKLVGPRDEVAAERAAFLAFCNSLVQAP